MIRPIIFGKFVLLERVNVGGMAEIYRAKLLNAPSYERYFAIKRILPSLAADEEFLNMFVDEAKITVELNHPNVCQIYELGRLGQSHYIAMEYISGKDVLAMQNFYRKQRKIMSVSQACFIAAQVAQGLDYAHQACNSNGVPLNLIHRDVTPQNILVSFDGTVKLIDFGVARATTKKKKTESGILKGKYSYMSPEQVQNEEIDYRSDIFSLGVVLWEMLTGRRLFHAESEFAIMTQISECDIVPPSKHNRMVTPEVDRIVMRALEKDRNKRYLFAGELAIDLWNFINGCKPPFTQWHLQNWMCTNFAADLEKEWEKLPEFQAVNTPEDVERARAQYDAENKNNDAETHDKHGNIIPSIESDANASLIAELFSSGAFDIDALAANPTPDTPQSAPPALPQIPANATKSSLPPVPKAAEKSDSEKLDITVTPDDDEFASSVELIPESIAPDVADPETQFIMDRVKKAKQRKILNITIASLASAILIVLILIIAGVIPLSEVKLELPSVANLRIQVSNINEANKPSITLKLYDENNVESFNMQASDITESGEFLFKDIDHGNYKLDVSLDGYHPETFAFAVENSHGNFASTITLSNPVAVEKDFNVTVSPEDAEIYVNGVLVEGTGAERTLKGFDGKEYKIVAKRNGFTSVEQTYTLGSKDNLEPFELTKGIGSIFVRSNVERAEVWINTPAGFKRECIAPCSVENLDPSEVLKLEVRAKGYVTWERVIEFGAKFNRKYYAELTK